MRTPPGSSRGSKRNGKGGVDHGKALMSAVGPERRWIEGKVMQYSRAKEGGSRLRYHEVKNAGHWLHVDNPGGLRDVLAPEMARLCASLTS